MTTPGALVVFGLMIVLSVAALLRGHGSFRHGLIRGAMQLTMLLPRMTCALVAAGFLSMLIPTNVISSLLGTEAGFLAIVVAMLSGMLIPAGPVISFSIAAVLASQGASTPALVSFITSWSVFALHRVFIFEIPLLGFSFTRLRILSGLILPLLAGGLALTATKIFSAS